MKAPAIRRRLLRWAASGGREFAWRGVKRSCYEVLIAEILLKRTTATAAARVYEEFLDKFPSIDAIDAAAPCELEAALVTIGLQKQRALGLKRMAAHLVEVESGAIPRSIDRLLLVPHLGPYAARAVASFAFGVRTAIVDSNVERVLRRLFCEMLGDRPKIDVLQRTADQLFATSKHREYNLAVLDFGASVCRYADPKCGECPLKRVCDYYQRIHESQDERVDGRGECAMNPWLPITRLSA